MSSFCENFGSNILSVEELIPKKVRFRDKDEDVCSDMMIDLTSSQLIYWKDKLVGHSAKVALNGPEEKEDFDILEGDIQKSFNKIYSLWKPSAPVHMMDIENGFPSLSGYLYKNKVLTEVGETVRKVVKLDMNTHSRVRGCFARMAIYVNLEKPLVSKILINGRSQKVPTICFHCGRYGHVEGICTFRKPGPTVEKEID
ncbi:hypothetical protein Goarm_012831 [Gossypium armourianum]|uniref:CCHC-type domain-containing protein n=1 Tax=Gossypium armourianum TaxID=34283 RepID=A0A7J9J125_9ROSI|nr:hypothetical protein [Gossypium armourianum]